MIDINQPDTWPGFSLCTGVERLPTGDQWVYEQKLDGVRVMASYQMLRLRNIVLPNTGMQTSDLQGLPAGCLLDGELLAVEPGLIPAQVMSLVARRRWSELCYQPFDLLAWNYDHYSARTYHRRFGTLSNYFPTVVRLSNPDEIPDDWEGVVAKNGDQTYTPGRQWFKKKNWWLMDAICTDLQYRAGELVTCSFAIHQDGERMVPVGKAVVNDPVVNAKLASLWANKCIQCPITVRHFGLRPGGVKNPHVIQVGGT